MKPRELVVTVRNRHRWTQPDLARLFGVGRRTVQRWELDEARPSPWQLEALEALEALDPNVSWARGWASGRRVPQKGAAEAFASYVLEGARRRREQVIAAPEKKRTYVRTRAARKAKRRR